MRRQPATHDKPVQITRRFPLTPEEMFVLWTQPEHMKRWLHPSPEWSTPVVKTDLRVGGAYRLGFSNPQQSGIAYVIGRFVEIDENRRLVYTWGWESPDPHAGIETVVTVEFAAVDAGAEVTVTHELFPTAEVRARHEEGWRGTFECLAALVEGE